MRFRIAAAAAVCSLMIPAAAAAQDFGVMNSAETINRGNGKFMANPIVVFGKNDEDNHIGLALAGGYGFTDIFDVEGRLAFYDEVTFIGADAEVWLVKGQPVDVSAIAGFHVEKREGLDSKAFDFTFLGSGHVSPRLEIYGGFDLARTAIDEIDVSFTTLHLVPGIEYAISPDLDFVAELGIALNDDSRHYLSAGLAFYFR